MTWICGWSSFLATVYISLEKPSLFLILINRSSALHLETKIPSQRRLYWLSDRMIILWCFCCVLTTIMGSGLVTGIKKDMVKGGQWSMYLFINFISKISTVSTLNGVKYYSGGLVTMFGTTIMRQGVKWISLFWNDLWLCRYSQ